MGERTGYPPGTFSWVDLATTDTAGAKAFYRRLFRWEADDRATGDGGTYTMLRRDGADVAGLSELRAEQAAQGVPPHWTSYVSVADADAVADRARELGGTVLAPPFDVLDSGRMAIIADPQGAVLAVWQPRAHHGAAVVNEPGALTWNDLLTFDPQAAAPFYEALFGWEVEPVGGDVPYWTIRNTGRGNGGIMAMPEQQRAAGVPPVWNAYFAVADLDAAVATVQEAGGRVLVPPTQVQAGRFAVVADPQGAVFSLFAGEFDD